MCPLKYLQSVGWLLEKLTTTHRSVESVVLPTRQTTLEAYSSWKGKYMGVVITPVPTAATLVRRAAVAWWNNKFLRRLVLISILLLIYIGFNRWDQQRDAARLDAVRLETARQIVEHSVAAQATEYTDRLREAASAVSTCDDQLAECARARSMLFKASNNPDRKAGLYEAVVSSHTGWAGISISESSLPTGYRETESLVK